MARLDVYKNHNGNGYLLDLQTDLLTELNTRVVVPLFLLTDSPLPATNLNPVFEIEGTQVVMMTQYIASIPAIELRDYVTHIKEFHTEVTDALDMLFLGF